MSIQYEVIYPKEFPPANTGVILFDRKIAFTGHVNGFVVLWDLELNEHRIILDSDSSVQSISNYESKKIAIGYHSGGLYIYDIDKNEITEIRSPSHSVYNRIWKTIWLNENELIYTSTYGEVTLLKIENGETSKLPLKGHAHSIFAINKKDGKIISGDYRGNIIFWDKLGNGEYFDSDKFNVSGTIQDLYWYNDNCFAAINRSGTLYLVENIKDSGWQISTEVGIAKGGGNCVILTHDGDSIYAGTDQEIIQFDVTSYQVKTIDLSNVKKLFLYGDYIYALTSYAILSYKKERLEISSDLISYKFKKISLLGHTGTGKSTFCKLLVFKNVDGIFSTFGKRIWNYRISNKEDIEKRIILHDHGGQETVIDTFLPFINDSDIILLFYKQTDKLTFRRAYDLYNDLINKLKIKPDIYFVQTYIDHDVDEVPYSLLEELLSDGSILDVIKMSPSNKVGVREFNEKVISKIKWDNAKFMISSPHIEGLNEVINILIMSKIPFLSYDDFKQKYQDELNIKIADGHLKFLLSDLSNKGLIEYYPEILEDTIIINDEEFNRMRTEIPILVDHNEGIINIQDIEKTFANQDYIRILDEIYSNSRISFKFRNLRIFPQKLRESGITVIDEYRKALLETEPIEIILNYQKIDLSYLLESFSEMRLRCLDVSNKEGLFGWGENAFIYYSIQEEGSEIAGKKIKIMYYVNGKKNDRILILKERFYDLINRFYGPILKEGEDKNKKKEYEFDVALSFAGEQRSYVEIVANILRFEGIRVFYDEFYQSHLWGKNLIDYFKEVYYTKSKYCIMFISKEYLKKMWPTYERKNANARDLEEFGEYILPVIFERNLDVPGLDAYRGYLGVWKYSAEDVAKIFLEKRETES